MIAVAIMVLPLIWPAPAFGDVVSSKTQAKDYVILLHGLARSSGSMSKLASCLNQSGYQVVNFGYPSTQYPIDHLVNLLDKKIQSLTIPCLSRIHFVCHSLGGIIVRSYLKNHPFDQLGRVVMLSPPNHGSEVVDRLKNVFLFKWINGPSGGQLGTEKTSIPQTLGPVNFELGVITGNKAAFYDQLFSYWIPGEDDGKVSVESAKVEGMTDFLVMPYNHTFIMNKEPVIQQIIYYLNHGQFRK